MGKPRPPAGGSRRSTGGSRSRKKKDKEAIDMDDDGESSLDKPPDSMVLDPITGTMVPNLEHQPPDMDGLSTPPNFEADLEPKSSRPKFKSNARGKPTPKKTLLQFSKKKRRSDSDDDYGGEDYEPEEGRRRRGRTAVDDEEELQDSPKVDDNTERRKSSRSRKATKYVDDTDYGFEDVQDDNAVNIPISNEILPEVTKAPSEGPVSEGAAVDAVTSATPSITGPSGADPEASNASTVPGSTVPGTPIEGVLDTSTTQSGPNYAFVDVTAEDTMIVQYILSSRMGTRELEDDEQDPGAFEVPREVMNKYGRGPLPPRTQIESDILRMKEDKEKERRKSLNVSVEESKESDSKMQQAAKVEEVNSAEEKKSTISKTDTTGDENDKELKEEDGVNSEKDKTDDENKDEKVQENKEKEEKEKEADTNKCDSETVKTENEIGDENDKELKEED